MSDCGSCSWKDAEIQSAGKAMHALKRVWCRGCLNDKCRQARAALSACRCSQTVGVHTHP